MVDESILFHNNFIYIIITSLTMNKLYPDHTNTHMCVCVIGWMIKLLSAYKLSFFFDCRPDHKLKLYIIFFYNI